MELIAQQVVPSNVATIEFSGLPQTFRDLVLIASYSISRSNETVTMNLSSANESSPYVLMSGNGSATFSEAVTDTAIGLSRHVATSAGAKVFVRADILDYSQTDKHKVALIRRNDSNLTQAIAARQANTAAVTTIRFTASNLARFETGSVFTIYGLAG